ncbi:hypothetical protein R1sor_016165 [Riccia sorocarpa]|uniref:Helicase MAGATAMA 3 n=1 Tax=Riccia sorocarpa TaxID=122646 RepID=A0ABD3HG84_9MARC
MGTKKRKCQDQEEATEEDDCFHMQLKIVNMLREKVYRLEEELNYLRSHQRLLLKAWSMPVYPPEYVPGSWNPPSARPQDEQTDMFNRAGTSQFGGDKETAKKAKKRKTKKARTSTPDSSPERETPPIQVIVDDSDASEDSKETSSESEHENRAKKGLAQAKRRKTQKKAKTPTPVSSPERVAPTVHGTEDASSDDPYASSDDSKSSDEKGSPMVETVTMESAARSGSASFEISSSEEEAEKDKSSQSDSESENSSDSEDEKTPETPAIGETKSQAKFPKVNWANEPRKRKPGRDSSSSGSDSNDSDDSVSVVEIADEGVTIQQKGKEKELQKDEVKDSTNNYHLGKRNKQKEDLPKKAAEDSGKYGEAKLKKKERASATSAEPSTTSRRAKLSQDATAEEIFDWNVLGTQGPWTQPEPVNFTHWHGSTEDSGQWVKQLISLPFSFSSCEEYISRNQWLIFEECKAMLNSSLEIMEKNDGSVAESTLGSDGTEDSLENRKFRIRPMYRCAGDSFNYFELEALDGRRFKLDTSEVLLVSFPSLPSMKVLALASTRGDNAGLPTLLKTRVDLQSSSIQCKLARMSNMVTLKRQFVALVRISKIWHSLRQPLLDPLWNNGCCLSPPSDDCLDENVRLPEDISTTLSTWKEHGIFNNRQLLTMAALLQMKQGILLVQGPPGTGKVGRSSIVSGGPLPVEVISKTIRMISALCLEEPGVKILVCASSNAAVDEIVTRLKNAMLDSHGKVFSPQLGKLVRVGLQKSVQPACHDVTMDTLLAKSSKDSRPTRAQMMSNATIVCSTLSGSGHSVFEENNQKFDVLVIDCIVWLQALECEALIALHRARGRCVIVGDPCQLSATVIQRPGTAYGRSLFERMQGGGMKTFLMTTQYRMHPQISKYPSAKFYRGCLRDSNSTRHMPSIFTNDACETGIRCDGYHFRLGPYCFLDVSWGTEEIEATGHSLSNAEEASVVATVVHGVVKSLAGGRKADIGVITPYLAQRSAILNSLSKYSIDETVCEVNTVDGFQGREKDVIILSCVRAVTDRGLGFVSDEKRMNVALTRAKHALIIVGHAKTLKSQSASWNSLLQNAAARGCYQVLRESDRKRKGSGKPSRVGETPPTASEKAAKFHSAQTSPVKKPQFKLNPVHTPVKVEQETCSFAHHVPGCGHSQKQNDTGLRQTAEPIKKMRGAVRVDRSSQYRGGGRKGKGGRKKSLNGARFPDHPPPVVPPPNQHKYFEQQQSFSAPNLYYSGEHFEEAHEHFASIGRGAHMGWTLRQPVDQGRPYRNSTHANRGRR